MSRNRFVQPDVVRLPLSDGDYLDVRKQLTHGEREDFFATIAPFDNSGLSKVDRHLLRTERVLTYLIGWSFTNKDGSPVAMSPDLPKSERESVIKMLDPSDFDEIHKAIETHIEKIDAEREKNVRSATTAPEAS